MIPQPSSKTYTLEFEPGDLFGGDEPDSVKVTITREDVLNWLRLAAVMKAENLLAIERLDNRCDFIFEGLEPDDQPYDMDEVDFRPDFMRLQIHTHDVSFVGSLKNGNDHWETSMLMLNDLAEDFGIEV